MLANIEQHGVTRISASPAFFEQLVTQRWAAGQTLKQVLTDIVADYLDDFSVTLDAAQANGPTMGALSYDMRTLTEVLNDLQSLASELDSATWVWSISAAKVFGMYSGGLGAAPWSITSSSGG